ncbi:hypothetical protein [Rhodoferax sp.]|nr:hypothetical protein [Rhodoferax sp.]MCM2295484.1 hypothetical protein [Rhodoferax sp.]MDD3937320.1 hypothetical protein [Rhodoferax sp.]
MAKNTGLVLLINRIADFRFAVGMDDRAVLADHPETFDSFLLANVLDDFFSDIAFVQQHGVAGAGNHDIRNLHDMVGNDGLHVRLPVLDKKQGGNRRRHGKGNKQVHTDFELEIIFDH